MIYERKGCGCFDRGRGNQDLTESKDEANNLHKIFHIMSVVSVK